MHLKFELHARLYSFTVSPLYMVSTAQLEDKLWHTRHEHKKHTSTLRLRRSAASVLRPALSLNIESFLLSSPSLRLNAGRSRLPAWSLGKRAVSVLGAGRQAGRGQRQAVGTTAQRTSGAPAPGGAGGPTSVRLVRVWCVWCLVAYLLRICTI
jgi:hypothetical protein